MKSLQQVENWHRTHQDFEMLKEAPEFVFQFSGSFADIILEDQQSRVEDYRERILTSLQSPDALRELLEFEEMDDGLYRTLSALLFSLVQRDDISEVDQVISNIIWFVQMCPHFYKLRLASMWTVLSEKPPKKPKAKANR